MRSFQQALLFLFALFACAFAQSSEEVYDATVYVTSTVYRVNTVTLSGSPTASLANSTSVIRATPAPSYAAGNRTTTLPTGTGAKPSQPVFTGAAAVVNGNAALAALAAGLGYLAYL